MATTLTVRVEDVPEGVLAGLDGLLVVDGVALADLVRCAAYHVWDDLGGIVDEADPLRAEDLRSFADRLGRLAALADSI